MNVLQNLQESLYKGFIDQTLQSGERFKPIDSQLLKKTAILLN